MNTAAILLLTALVSWKCGNPACVMCYGYQYYNQPQTVYRQSVVQTLPDIVATPNDKVAEMLSIVNPSPEDLLYDLGCGDGRIVIAAAQNYGCKAVGIELDSQVADLASSKVRQAGVRGIRIVKGDALKYVLDKATIITMYLESELIAQLSPKFTNQQVISYMHPIPDHDNKKIGSFYYVDLRWKNYLGY